MTFRYLQALKGLRPFATSQYQLYYIDNYKKPSLQ